MSFELCLGGWHTYDFESCCWVGSSPWSVQYVRGARCVCEAFKHILQIRAYDLVQEANDHPVVQVYMSDGTPVQTPYRVCLCGHDIPTFKRYGKEMHGLFAQVAFLQAARS